MDEFVVVTTERLSIPSRYRLIEEVGQGGMAVVFRARDESLRREVAVKILHAHLAKDPESKGRFEREAQAIAKLKHENIPAVFDYSGADAPDAYIVSEFIDGQTLRAWLAGARPRHPEIGAMIALELGAALGHAHELGIIHRDVKPENVMIRRDGVIKLMDFGIAQVIDLQRMTVTGQLLGSPAYMAPELVEGKCLDFRSDVFSAGVVFYELITGQLPFSGKNPHEVLHRITEGKFADPRLHNKLVSDELRRIVARALARHPEGRYPDIAAFATDLRAYLAEAGIENPHGELAAFFASPATYEAALDQRLVHGLIATAARYVEERKMPRALACWNRALALDPANPAVLAALGKLEGRHRLRVALGTTLAVAGLGGLCAGLVLIGPRWFSRSDDNQPVTPPFRSHHEPAKIAAAPSPPPAKDPGPVRGVETTRARGRLSGSRAASGPGGGPAVAVLRAPVLAPGAAGDDVGRAGVGKESEVLIADRGSGPSTEPAPGTSPASEGSAPRTFSLGPTPQNVDVYLDGKRQFAYGPDHTQLAVPWDGLHVIELRSPSGCCFAEKIEVGPERPVPSDGIIARRLKWRPARLAVTVAPPRPDARILLTLPGHQGRRTVIRPGEEATIAFDGDDEAVQEVELTVDLDGRLVTDRVTVRAGQLSTHAINDPMRSP